MKIIEQFGIIFAVCFMGLIISEMLPIAFPSSVIALFLLFIFLWMGAVKEHQIKTVSDFFLNNMAFFYVAPSVSIIEYLSELKSAFLPILIISMVSTVLTFVATAYTAIFVKKLMHMRGGKTHE